MLEIVMIIIININTYYINTMYCKYMVKLKIKFYRLDNLYHCEMWIVFTKLCAWYTIKTKKENLVINSNYLLLNVIIY